jgi:AcrR family transcriptional regulator
MPIKDCQTEKLIIDTAMNVFFAEGRLYATTQDIADAAGVNRTLINYYFRSKDELLAKVIQKAHEQFVSNSDAILISDLPFRKKTEQFMDDFMDKLLRFPYLESFLTVDIIQQRLSKNSVDRIPKESPQPILRYLKEIENEMLAGTIPQSNPVHFMINLVSLMIYPIIMRPLQMRLLNISNTEYDQVLTERKQIILDLLFPEITNATTK